ncbi:hypothetical protein [Adhaeribacter pallidiroseus]|uniref:Uncharacterized protein n=1 Tax=Adhaeribacter pallidiroseus TaxID=2072847 RepID=A0A369QP51_9BACT|nr:hypothetical protein [Adhaeribacter pallidiroseus]RDC65056.1 hypothetical protein AHMF7616_03679 [Adhaeribacter pallidiroseus]
MAKHRKKHFKSKKGLPLLLLAAGIGYMVYRSEDKLTLAAKLTRNIQFETVYAGNSNHDYSTYA